MKKTCKILSIIFSVISAVLGIVYGVIRVRNNYLKYKTNDSIKHNIFECIAESLCDLKYPDKGMIIYIISMFSLCLALVFFLISFVLSYEGYLGLKIALVVMKVYVYFVFLFAGMENIKMYHYSKFYSWLHSKIYDLCYAIEGKIGQNVFYIILFVSVILFGILSNLICGYIEESEDGTSAIMRIFLACACVLSVFWGLLTALVFASFFILTILLMSVIIEAFTGFNVSSPLIAVFDMSGHFIGYMYYRD